MIPSSRNSIMTGRYPHNTGAPELHSEPPMEMKNFIKELKDNTTIPLLRKDFIIDEWQIYESFHYNVDCILLILAILDDLYHFRVFLEMKVTLSSGQ